MPDQHANFAASTVAVAPSPATTGLTLTLATGDGGLLPAPPFNCIVCPTATAPKASNAEIVRVTGVAGDVVTMVRAQEGTSARTIIVGDQFYAAITKKTLTDMETPQQNTAARMYRNAATTIPSGAWTKFPFDTLSTNGDPGGNVQLANNRYVCPATGYYQVNSGLVFPVPAATELIGIAIFKNGVQTANGSAAQVRGATANDEWGVTVNDMVYCAAGDYLEIFIYQNSGSSMSPFVGTAANNYFSVVQVGGVLPPPGAGGQGIFGAHTSAAAQLGSATALSKVALNTKDFDLSGWFDATTNYRFQPLVAGYYQITAGIAPTANLADGDQLQLYLYKTGGVIASGAGGAIAQTGQASAGLGPQTSALVYLNGSTDYLELWGVCLTSAGAQVATTFNAWITGALVTPSPVATVLPTYSDVQNGVVGSGDCALSGVAISGAGAVTFTLAAANPLWVTLPSGALIPLTFPGGTFVITPATKPASGQNRAYGVEIDSNGMVALSTSAADQGSVAAALTNGNTVPAAGKLRIADIVMLNTSGTYSLPASSTRDRRPWARGALSVLSSTSDYATTAALPGQAIDTTNLQARVECNGRPLRVRVTAPSWLTSSVPLTTAFMALFVDGSQQGSTVYTVSDTMAPQQNTAARAYRSATLAALSAGAATKVPLDAKTSPGYDPGGNFDTTSSDALKRYNVPATGYYAVSVLAAISTVTGTQDFFAYIYKNGAEVSRSTRYANAAAPSAGTAWEVAFSDIVQCNAGDYLELYVYCNTASTIVASAAQTAMAVVQVGGVVSGIYLPAQAEFVVTPAAGSRLITPYHGSTGGTSVTLKGTLGAVVVAIEELLRPSANNGTS